MFVKKLQAWRFIYPHQAMTPATLATILGCGCEPHGQRWGIVPLGGGGEVVERIIALRGENVGYKAKIVVANFVSAAILNKIFFEGLFSV